MASDLADADADVAISDDAANLRRLQAMLQDLGYKAEIRENNDRSIFSAASGLKFTVIHDNRHSLQFYMSMSLTKSKFDAVGCNEFNRKYRFAKTYIDTDNDLSMEYDFLFDIDNAGASESLQAYLVLWEGVLGLIQTTLRDSIPAEA